MSEEDLKEIAETEEETEKSEKRKSSNASGEEDDDHKFVYVAPPKDKLDANQLALFGFNDVEVFKVRGPVEVVARGGGDVGVGTKHQSRKKEMILRKKSKHETVVYGMDSDDDLDDTDYQQGYDNTYTADADISEAAEEIEEEIAERFDYTETMTDIDIDDNMWEDEEDEDEEEEDEDSEEREEAELEARLAAELERERIRELRLEEIRQKKEILIERYLKVARVMIHHRKKNIYLQDYLYHLAFRKGLLRGDPPVTHFGATGDSDKVTAKLQRAQERREKHKTSTMNTRFARFLRKSGHLWDPEQDSHHHDHIHHHRQTVHHHHTRKNLARGHAHHDNLLRGRLSRTYNMLQLKSLQKANQTQQQHHPHTKQMHKVAATVVKKGDPHEACVFGKDCRAQSQKKEHKLHLKMEQDKLDAEAEAAEAKEHKRRGGRRPMTIMEKLEAKAAATVKKMMKGPTDTLEIIERHRCKMVKRKQRIQIAMLLQRQYAGTSLIDQERRHLISFVEHSVTSQNAAKKKALRKQKHQQEKEIKSMGVQHMNHLWFKSLDRIRELRLKKAKLEQEHRLELMKKMKHWHVWEKRDFAALEGVYDFVINISSRVSMSKREAEHFYHGLDQFWKQLHTLFNTVLQQLIRLFKARALLYMAQRRVKDSASVSTPMKGFSITDYQRMIIENEESHQKLKEKQESLKKQQQKLKGYVEKVSIHHLKKQSTWGSLRAGRHDMKQLYQLCQYERNNLLKKAREIRKSDKRHRKFFNQTSVLSNKNCLKDYHHLVGNVEELEDQQRKLNTMVQQRETVLRVLKVKVQDAKKRIDEDDRISRQKLLKEDLAFYRRSMKQRITPSIPGTIHAANMMSRESMERIYSLPEKDRPRCGYYYTTHPSPRNGVKRDSNTENKLPLIAPKGQTQN